MKRIFLVVLVLALFGCSSCPAASPTRLGVAASCTSNVKPPPPILDGGVDDCAAACARGRALQCPGAQNTPRGASCEEFCTNLQDLEATRWDLHCRAVAGSCTAFDGCELPH